jgi:hypothetical protein
MKKIIYTFIIAMILILVFLLFSDIGTNKQDNKHPDTSGTTVKTDSTEQILMDKISEPSKDTISNPPARTKDLTAKTQAKDSTVKPQSKKIIVYYFHPTARCSTCINIENFTQETVESKFRKEQKDKTLFFKSVNIEDSLNEHFVKDFNLTSSSVILVKYEGKKRTGWKNLEKVWALEKDKEKFSIYIKIELQQFLKKLKEEQET